MRQLEEFARAGGICESWGNLRELGEFATAVGLLWRISSKPIERLPLLSVHWTLGAHLVHEPVGAAFSSDTPPMPLVAMQFPCIRPSLSEKSTSTSHLGPDHLHQNVSVSNEAARHVTDMSGPGKHMRRHLSIVASLTSKLELRATLLNRDSLEGAEVASAAITWLG